MITVEKRDNNSNDKPEKSNYESAHLNHRAKKPLRWTTVTRLAV
jgi:hypothetical protein